MRTDEEYEEHNADQLQNSVLRKDDNLYDQRIKELDEERKKEVSYRNAQCKPHYYNT